MDERLSCRLAYDESDWLNEQTEKTGLPKSHFVKKGIALQMRFKFILFGAMGYIGVGVVLLALALIFETILPPEGFVTVFVIGIASLVMGTGFILNLRKKMIGRKKDEI